MSVLPHAKTPAGSMSARHGGVDLVRTRSGAPIPRHRARAAFSSPSPAERCASRMQPQRVPTAHALSRRVAEGGRERRARTARDAIRRRASDMRSGPFDGGDGNPVHKRVPGLGPVPRAGREPRCHSAYSSQEWEAKNAFCCSTRGCTLPQSLSSTYWRASISRRARATARSLREYVATPASCPATAVE